MAKCVIDGKDASGDSVFGALVAVIGSGSVELAGVRFSGGRLDKDTPWAGLLRLVSAQRPVGHPERFRKLEGQMRDFVFNSGILRGGEKLNDLRSIEREISYFCSSSLGIKAIAFLELMDADKASLDELIPALSKPGGDEAEHAGGGLDDSREEDAPRGTDVFVRCEPALDPVSGVAASELEKGFDVRCRLPEDSVFYKLMTGASRDFDGTVSGEVIDVHVGEDGETVVALKLSDDVSGAFRVPSRVRVKMASAAVPPRGFKLKVPGIQMVLATAAVAAFLCVMWILLRALS
ncbi:MAG: hypothetical protein LBS75_04840 [Synergistaceae bacterium]|nr:hypothetical protein [Synergistaceae bacterium]